MRLHRLALPLLASGLLLGGCSSWFETAPTKTKTSTQQTAAKKQPVPKAAVTPHAPLPQPPASAPDATATTAAPSNLGSMIRERQVAILLPLSGKNAALGQAMLNAAQMAVFDLGTEHFALMPRDTAGAPEKSAAAAREALAGGAEMIIGPLFAADVAAVKPIVQASPANMLALSSDASLAEPSVYVMGFSPASMAARVTTFALHRGLRNFASLTPQNAYGRLVETAFEGEILRARATLVAAESYTNAGGIEAAVKKLAAQKDRIDALFIPAGGMELSQIASALAANGFDPARVKFLGSGLWEDTNVAQMAMLNGAWFPAPDAAARESFVKNYTQTYGVAPPRLATLAYDATALAAVLSRKNQMFDRAALTNGSGFAGLDGIFRLTPQGIAERGLSVYEVTPTSVELIEPAPASFQ